MTDLTNNPFVDNIQSLLGWYTTILYDETDRHYSNKDIDRIDKFRDFCNKCTDNELKKLLSLKNKTQVRVYREEINNYCRIVLDNLKTPCNK